MDTLLALKFQQTKEEWIMAELKFGYHFNSFARINRLWNLFIYGKPSVMREAA